MKKLKLNIDELKVESFEVSSKVRTKNTVDGYGGLTFPPATEPTGPNYGATCLPDCILSGPNWDTCVDTCANTCEQSCYPVECVTEPVGSFTCIDITKCP